ncbi:MAG: protein kinase family protein [Candidatus Eremiobacteraeota bacterium]|nr:protein kinase family protein [Candidatus Eremiobacteraeota bacterium]
MDRRCGQCGAKGSPQGGFCARCGHPLGRDVLIGGAVIASRYRITSTVASFEYGTIYRAHDLHLAGGECIIKEFLPEYVEASYRQQAMSGFREQAFRLAGIPHEGLPPVKDCLDHQGKQYLVLASAFHSTLLDLLEEARSEGKKGLAQQEVIRWGIALAGILGALHRAAPPFIFIHVKPSCILVDRERGSPRLVHMEMDYRHYVAGLEHSGASPALIAPEVFKGLPETRSDLYALGKTLIFLLTGEEPNPFMKSSLASLLPGAREGLVRALEKATHENPAGRYPDAGQFGESLLRLLVEVPPPHTPVDARRYSEKALELLKSHQIEEAIMECNKALIVDPAHMEAYLCLGHAYLREGRTDLALEKYKKAESLAKGTTKIHCNKALALYHLGRIDEAIRENEKALELDPANAIARNNLGSILREEGKHREALAEYEKALAYDRTSMAAYYNIGLTHYDLGNFEDSAAASAKALELDTGNLHAAINLSLAYFQLGKMDLFIELNEKVLTADPGNARALNNHGVACYAMGAYEDAAAAFRKALASDSAMESSVYNLKMVEEEFQRKET